MSRNRQVAIVSATALAVLLLSGCAGSSVANPSPKPSLSATATPATSSPSVTTTAQVFTGTINYESLTGEQWESRSILDKYAACNEFFTSNIENEAVMTQNSTGPEVQTWFTNRLNIVQSLVLDKSNELNFEASKNIVDCLTKIDNVSEKESIGHKNLLSEIVGLHQTDIEGSYLGYIDPAKITRYSDGLYDATSTTSLPYMSLSVEGHQKTTWGSTDGNLLMTYYEWASAESAYRYILTSPAYDETVPLYFGPKPPIVLDPARQNARADMNF